MDWNPPKVLNVPSWYGCSLIGEPMKHLAYSLALVVAITSSFGAAVVAASDTDMARFTCADFMVMSAEDKRVALKTLTDHQTGSAKPTKPQATDQTERHAGSSDAGDAVPGSGSSDLNETAVDPEVEAVMVACECYEAAFVADRMTPDQTGLVRTIGADICRNLAGNGVLPSPRNRLLARETQRWRNLIALKRLRNRPGLFPRARD